MNIEPVDHPVVSSRSRHGIVTTRTAAGDDEGTDERMADAKNRPRMLVQALGMPTLDLSVDELLTTTRSVRRRADLTRAVEDSRQFACR